MDSEHWARLRELFEAARTMSPDERAAYLDRQCGSDEELRHRVESLILHDREPGGTMDRVVAHMADSVSVDSLVRDRTVGPYRLVKEIGRGGMGSVWLAVRDDDAYQKDVAVKLMRDGMHSADRVARFRSERQILAALEHPNIARLIDGGNTDGGIPYVVMEHVEGRPLDVYCNEERLSTQDRLDLFLKICSAVSYAHSNLVVHRDIKPGNILVDSAGVPKLLDFGIAKLLDPALVPHTLAETGTAMRLLTPEYASPEQVRGAPISTASDVYSLGVLLYELLTGHLPYRLQTRAPEELMQKICEQTPERPSTAVARDADVHGSPGTASEIARARRSTPERLRRRLHGDLDNIVLMALRKEPERRYASATQLAEDIRRCLDGLPVIARPATWRYRTEKFVSRNRWAVIVTASVLLIIGSTVAFYTLRLQDERDRARVSAHRAERLSEFLTGLFGEADPFKARGAELTAKEILERGTKRIETDLSDEPEVQATMLVIMSRSYRRMGKPELAHPLAAKALEIRQSLYEEPHPAIADSLVELGWVLKRQLELEDALRTHTHALEMRKALFGDRHVATAESYHLVAMAYEDLGDQERAEELYRKALALRRELDDPYVAESLNNLASLLRVQKRYDEAVPLFDEAVEVFRASFGEDYPDTIGAKMNRANLYREAERAEEAAAVYLEVVEQRRRIFGPDHPELAVVLNNLGLVYVEMERFAEAEAPLREALAIYDRNYGPENPRYCITSTILCDALIGLGKYEEAEDKLLQIRSTALARQGQDHWLIDFTAQQLVTLYDAWGHPEKAAPYRTD